MSYIGTKTKINPDQNGIYSLSVIKIAKPLFAFAVWPYDAGSLKTSVGGYSNWALAEKCYRTVLREDNFTYVSKKMVKFIFS